MKSFYVVKSFKKIIASLRAVFIIDLFQIDIDLLQAKSIPQLEERNLQGLCQFQSFLNN